MAHLSSCTRALLLSCILLGGALPAEEPGPAPAAETPKDPPVAPVQPKPPAPPAADDGGLEIAQRPEPPPADCAACRNSGRAVSPSLKMLYVLFENEEAPPAEASLGWLPCTQCVRGKAHIERLEAEGKRLDRDARHKGYALREKQLGMDFIDFETRQVTGHFQTSPNEAKATALLFEQVALKLRERTGAAILRGIPEDLHIAVVENEANYLKYLGYVAGDPSNKDLDENWKALAKKTSSFGSRNLTVIRRDLVVPPKGFGLGHVAVFSFGQMLVRQSTENKAPLWFAGGFSSLCESLVFAAPVCYSVRYERNDVSFEPDWTKAVALALNAKKARQWATVFTLDEVGMAALDYQQCWSVVKYLYERDGPAFAKLPGLFAEGKDSAEALSEAYGQKLEQLEFAWTVWAKRGGK